MEWQIIEKTGILPNIIIKEYRQGDTLSHLELVPFSGYSLWLPSGDEYKYNDNGEMELDNTGNPIVLSKYYTSKIALPKNYDFTANYQKI